MLSLLGSPHNAMHSPNSNVNCEIIALIKQLYDRPIALNLDDMQMNVANISHSEIIEIKGPNVPIVHKLNNCMMYHPCGWPKHPSFQWEFTHCQQQQNKPSNTLNVFNIDVILLYFGLTR